VGTRHSRYLRESFGEVLANLGVRHVELQTRASAHGEGPMLQLGEMRERAEREGLADTGEDVFSVD